MVSPRFNPRSPSGFNGFKERKRRCRAWVEAPGAREAQPQGQAEHLMPLFVLLGAAPWKGLQISDMW